MSIKSIQEYYAKVEKLIRYGGSRNESVVSVETMKIIGQMKEIDQENIT